MSERLAGKVKEGRQSDCGKSIRIEDPYLSNLLEVRPARHYPQYLESGAKACLCPSLTLHSLTGSVRQLAGEGRQKSKRGMDVTQTDWSQS